MKKIHLSCQYSGCFATFFGSPQRKWCDEHKKIVHHHQQSEWAKRSKTLPRLDGSSHRSHKVDESKLSFPPFNNLVWFTGVCDRCEHTLFLERVPFTPVITYRLKCYCCGNYSEKEVKGIMATEPLRQKLTRLVNNWEEIYVSPTKDTQVKFASISEAEQARYIKSWLEQYEMEEKRTLDSNQADLRKSQGGP